MTAPDLLFDLDGTLTDNYTGIAASIRHALARLGADAPDDAALRRCVGPPLRATFARLLATDDVAAIERAIVHYRERFADVGWRENVPYPGIDEALAALGAAGARLFVCTAKPQPYAVRIVEHFGLARHFAGVYGADLDIVGRRLVVGNEGHGERRFLILLNAAPDAVDFALPENFPASAFVHVFDTGIADGLVRESPFVLKPGGGAVRLEPRTLALFQHAAESEQ